MSTATKSLTTPACELPEILRHIGTFLSQRDALECVLVCKVWHGVFLPFVWEHVETASGISPEDMAKHAHFIRTLSLAELEGLDQLLELCTRLETLILWPDAFEGEEDEEEEDVPLVKEADRKRDIIEGRGGLTVRERRTSASSSSSSSSSSSRVRSLSVSLPPDGEAPLSPVSLDSPLALSPLPDEDNPHLYKLVHLLARNPSLRRIEVYVEQKSPAGPFWRTLAEHSTRLVSFQSLTNLYVYRHIHLFLTMCSGLESLDLEQCTLRQLDQECYESLTFPKMKEIKFGRMRGMSLAMQLLWMEQCPALESLDWRVPHLGLPVKEFCEALKIKWRRLTSLTLPESRLMDHELGMVLEASANKILPPTTSVAFSNGCPRPIHPLTLALASPVQTRLSLGTLETFSVRRSDFGPLAFVHLTRHFLTLKTLDLFDCVGLSSAMTQEILSSCPNLESFDGNTLHALDIASAGLAWECLHIKYLDVQILGLSGQPDKIQWAVFEQLSKLSRLIFLSLGVKGSKLGRAIMMGGISLRVRSGMGQLRTLRRLRMLRFQGLEQEMDEEDVRWMIEHFKELRTVQGQMNTVDEVVQGRLEALFEENQIAVWTLFNQPMGS